MPEAPDTPAVSYISQYEQVLIVLESVVGANIYEIERDGVVILSPLTADTYADQGLVNGTTYEYRVRAGTTSEGNPTAWSDWTGIQEVTPQDPETETPFATVAELAAYWRTLTAEEQARAAQLLVIASNRLRLSADALGIDLDVEVADSEKYKTTVRWVVMEAVKRALQAPVDQQPVETYGQTAGPYSENFKYTNPTGDLWFKKSELSAIGLSAKQSLTGFSTTDDSLYESEEGY